MESEILAFGVGAGVALIAQALSHSLTLRRERRSDVVGTLDRSVSAFAEAERVIDDLTDAIERWSEIFDERPTPEAVESALNNAERVRVEMRAAVFSLRIRLGGDRSPVVRAFNDAFNTWEIAFIKSKIIVSERDPIRESLREARGDAERFRGEFYEVALERAADMVGPSKL